MEQPVVATEEETEDVIQLSPKNKQQENENATYKIRPNFQKK